ncbi:MAG TPA: alpha/beta hydrolase, partial [Acidimicrobiaceae bacterium]|nr:alpha/beta hydrolase [Acidimicrobiaceae bacterium]
MPFINVRDLQIYYEFHGDGLPLLHISGTGGDLRQTFPARSRLNEHFRGLHFDQRGLGQTSLGDHPPTMADFADDAAALCNELGWQRFNVVGTSFGGMVAQHLAIRHPELVGRLVLNCTSPGGDTPSYPLHELQSLEPEARAEAWMRLMDTRYEETGEIPGLEGLTSLFRKTQNAPLSEKAAAGLAAQLEARRHHDAVQGLKTIVAPTLVCAGRYDAIASVSRSERIA